MCLFPQHEAQQDPEGIVRSLNAFNMLLEQLVELRFVNRAAQDVISAERQVLKKRAKGAFEPFRNGRFETALFASLKLRMPGKSATQRYLANTLFSIDARAPIYSQRNVDHLAVEQRHADLQRVVHACPI